MAEPWSGQSLQALPATALGALGALGSEFLREWEAQDMRVTLFKLLLLWLVLSLLCIQLAWGFYGSTVTGLYHRPGTQESWPGHSLILCGYLVGHSSISKAGAAGTIQTWRHQTPSFRSHPELSRCEPGYGNSYPEHHPHIPLNPRREAGCLEEAEPQGDFPPQHFSAQRPGWWSARCPSSGSQAVSGGQPCPQPHHFPS
ncbi:T-cell leukemia translocation-altered gene protein isoform X1 [Myotis myotis]|uniref:T-cell leukemia translocation-altered gene protein isoform X1 n=1 Tax=Myotis myotis TaxID=51298 RepID=UPI001749CEE2|nr:T-cell leukemia translocation-altered gene protein isoform X1 [Myotis myotis]